MDSIRFFLGITKDYWGSFKFPILFSIALIGILVLEKEKIKRYTYLWYSLLVLVFIYNPISLVVSRKLLEPSTFNQYYLRFYSLIPIMVVVAYGFTLIVNKLSGVKKLFATVIVCGMIALLGNCIYTEPWFTKAENRNKVPQDVVTICDLFADYDGDWIRIMAPQDIAVYLRQMDSRFSMPYSRYIPKEAYELTNENPDPSVIVDYAKENDVDYVVVSAADSVLNTYLNYGFKLYGRTTYYAVLTPNDPSWILTEYEDASGDQGLAYTMKNVNDGTLIVVDGGNAGNEQQMRDAIKANGGVVDAWILTHYHKDHMDAFNAIYANPDGIRIKDIYVTPLENEVFFNLNLQEWDDVDTYKTFWSITEGEENLHRVNRDDVLNFSDGLKITFFNTCDEVVLNNPEDIPNNDSLVFKMETRARSILICADAHSQYLAEYLVKTYGDSLKSDILQCGHHGNNSMPTDTGFYQAVDPEIAIFDAPEWLMTGAEYSSGALAAYLQQEGARVVWYQTAPNIFGF